MKNLPNKNHTPFGKWFFTNPKVVRMRMLYEFEKNGISQATVRNWCYRYSLPAGSKRLNLVSKITGQNVVELFPY